MRTFYIYLTYLDYFLIFNFFDGNGNKILGQEWVNQIHPITSLSSTMNYDSVFLGKILTPSILVDFFSWAFPFFHVFNFLLPRSKYILTNFINEKIK